MTTYGNQSTQPEGSRPQSDPRAPYAPAQHYPPPQGYPAQPPYGQQPGGPYPPQSPAPSYAYPPPPAPVKKRRRWPWVVGIIALVALGCTIGGVAILGKAANDVANTEAHGSAPSANIGQPVRDGKFEFTITTVKCGVSHVGSSELGQDAQGQFCLVTMTVKNIGNEAQLFDASSQEAFNASGQKYDADDAAALYANGNDAAFLNNINPGNQVKGIVVFDIPKGQSIAKVELHDSPLSNGATVSTK